MLPEEMEKLVIDMGHPRYRADQILHAIYHESPEDISGLRQLPETMRTQLREAGYTLGSATEVERIVSQDGDTTKILLRLADNTLIEAVLIQYRSKKPNGLPRSTICVSTQAGGRGSSRRSS